MRSIVVLTFFAIAAPLALTRVCSVDQESRAPDKVAEMLHDIKVQRAMEVAIWATPAVGLHNIEKSIVRDLKGNPGDLVYFSQPMTAKQKILTANSWVPLVVGARSTKSGPVVMELPPLSEKASFSVVVVDAWNKPVVRLGKGGVDEGQGGKVLFLPPGFSGELPQDFLIYQPSTFGVHFSFRPDVNQSSIYEDTIELIKSVKIYPLQATDKDLDTSFIDASQSKWSTLPQYDLSFFEDVNAIVQLEPIQVKDKVMMQYLSYLGIEKGKEFTPDKNVEKALLEGLEKSYYYMQHYFETPGKALRSYWEGSHWMEPNVSEEQKNQGFPFEDDEKLLVDVRSGGACFWAAYLPFESESGIAFLLALRDQEGNLLKANENYKLRVPADTPVDQFWSVTVYSSKSKAFIENAKLVSLSSREIKKMKTNDDGSVDIYFGPMSPRGFDANWIPTREDFFVVFRLFGPLDAFKNKTWSLEDIHKL